MISKKDIEKLADLSRIEISEEEKDGFVKDIDSILSYVGQIKEANIAGSNLPENLVLKNVFREDVEPHESGKFTEEILAEAPKKENGYFKVKKIIDERAD
jgi:aspartyl-tRNA(Asn)/glutamyl-tRNA(Gln) amidotransferase subunit C